MNWEEIEMKWGEMARRVRSDLPNTRRRSGPEKDPPTIPPGDLPQPPLPEVECGIAS